MGGCAAGNEAFKAKQYKKAIGHYMQAGSPPPPATSPHAPRSLAESAAEPAHGGGCSSPQIGLFLTGPPFSDSGGGGGGGAPDMGMLMGGAGGGGEKLTDEQKEECDALKSTADLNLAACYLKEEKWEKAVARATKVLDNDPENTKALFRRGHGRIYINDLERARVRTKPPAHLCLRSIRLVLGCQ